MSKRKGRKQPLTSEIKSLRRPARKAAEVVELEPALHGDADVVELEPASDGERGDEDEPSLEEEDDDEAQGAASGEALMDPEVLAQHPDEPEEQELARVDAEVADASNGHDAPSDEELTEAETEDGEDVDVELPPLPALDSDEPEDTEAFLSGLMEALLFTSQKPLPLKDLARSAGIDRPRAKELLDRLIQSYRPRGVSIDEVAGGYVMRSSARYAPYVQKLLALRPVRLSRAQLETLAIVAYRQPVTKPEVDDIRGVDTGQVIKGLLERNLLKILGKKDEPGRPMLYGTTNDFLELLNLQSLKDLPTLREYTELSEESRRKFADEIGEEAPSDGSFAAAGESTPAEEPQTLAEEELAPQGDAEGTGTDGPSDEIAADAEETSERDDDVSGDERTPAEGLDADEEDWPSEPPGEGEDESDDIKDEADDDDDDDDASSDDDDDDDESDDDDDESDDDDDDESDDDDDESDDDDDDESDDDDDDESDDDDR